MATGNVVRVFLFPVSNHDYGKRDEKREEKRKERREEEGERRIEERRREHVLVRG